MLRPTLFKKQVKSALRAAKQTLDFFLKECQKGSAMGWLRGKSKKQSSCLSTFFLRGVFLLRVSLKKEKFCQRISWHLQRIAV